jgi:hypothetical protein
VIEATEMKETSASAAEEHIEPSCDVSFEQEMEAARKVMRRYRNALRQLATK